MEKQDVTKQTKQLLANPQSGVYILYGGEEYLKRRFLLDLKKKILPEGDDLNYSVFNAPEAAQQVLETSYMLPQFSDNRMVVWYNSSFPDPQKRHREQITQALSVAAGFSYLYLVVYLTLDELDPSDRTKLRLLKDKGFSAHELFFDFMPEDKLVRWAGRHFAAYKTSIGENELKLLCSRCAYNMTVIAAQTDKLCFYASEHGRDTVTSDDIERIVPHDETFSAFFISDCIKKRNAGGLVSYINDAETRGVSPSLICSVISAEAEKLCRIKYAQKAGMSQYDMPKALGLNEYVVKLSYAALRNITEERCNAFLHACYTADLQMKSTSTDAYGCLRQLACML